MKSLPVQAAVLLFAVSPAIAAQLTVTFLPESSLTWPAGTEFNGYVAQTDAPAGPFTNQSVMFRGHFDGGSDETFEGSHLVYRLRLDFDEEVILQSFTELAAGDHKFPSFIRLLDADRVEVRRKWLSGNLDITPVWTVLNAGARGKTFFIDVFDQSWNYRYRQRMVVAFTPAVDVIPVLEIIRSGEHVIVSWPASATGFSLETTPALLRGTAWTALTDGVVTVGDRFVLTNNAGAGSAFYRLRKP